MGVKLRLLSEERLHDFGKKGFYPHPSGMFAVNKRGDVLGRQGKVLKQKSQGHYNIVSYYTPCKKIRHKYVHRIIMETFVPERSLKDDLVVNHKDGNKINNNLENLEWVTSRENTIHAIAIGTQCNLPKKGQRGFQLLCA